MRKLQNLNNRFSHLADIRRKCENNIPEFNSVFLFIHPFINKKLNVF
jgi:hypothetical protein